MSDELRKGSDCESQEKTTLGEQCDAKQLARPRYVLLFLLFAGLAGLGGGLATEVHPAWFTLLGIGTAGCLVVAGVFTLRYANGDLFREKDLELLSPLLRANKSFWKALIRNNGILTPGGVLRELERERDRGAQERLNDEIARLFSHARDIGGFSDVEPLVGEERFKPAEKGEGENWSEPSSATKKDPVFDEWGALSAELSKSSDGVESIFHQSFVRMTKEIWTINKRAGLNLMIGTITAGVGVILLLTLMVLYMNGVLPASLSAEMAPAISRFGLVVLIELIAFFFLRLYRSSLGDIKYYQNEMSSFEALLASYRAAIALDDKRTISAVIMTLSKMERNRALEAGQSTVEIEMARLDRQEMADQLNALQGMIKGFVGQAEREKSNGEEQKPS